MQSKWAPIDENCSHYWPLLLTLLQSMLHYPVQRRFHRHESVFATLRKIEVANKNVISTCNITAYRFNKIGQWFDKKSKDEQSELYEIARNSRKEQRYLRQKLCADYKVLIWLFKQKKIFFKIFRLWNILYWISKKHKCFIYKRAKKEWNYINGWKYLSLFMSVPASQLLTIKEFYAINTM